MIEKVEKFNKMHGSKLSANIRMLDIISETGELSKEVIKSQSYGEKTFSLTKNLEMEFGDVLYALISFGIEQDIDIEKSLDIVLEKYLSRIKQKGELGS